MVALCSSCSLILDFSDSAVPKDAMIDGPYTKAECDFDEPNDSADTAMVITPGDSQGPAAICPPAGGGDDQDFYRFTVPMGTTKVTASISFTKRTGGDLDLRITDTTGNTLAQSRGFGGGETIVCPAASPPCAALAPGDYAIVVFPGVTGNVNDYTFSLKLQ